MYNTTTLQPRLQFKEVGAAPWEFVDNTTALRKTPRLALGILYNRVELFKS